MEKRFEGYVRLDGLGRPVVILFLKIKNGPNVAVPVTLSEKSQTELKNVLDAYNEEIDNGFKIERRLDHPGRRLEDREPTMIQGFVNKIKNKFK